MQEEREQPRQRRAEQAAGTHANGAAAETLEPGYAQVVHGAFDELLPVAGLTIAEVRRQFRDDIHLHPEAMALIDGAPAGDESQVVAPGQHLLFIRRSGEKGVAA